MPGLYRDSLTFNHLSSHPTSDGNDTIHIAQYRFFDQLSVDNQKASVGSFKFRDYPTGSGDLIGRWREHFIQRGIQVSI